MISLMTVFAVAALAQEPVTRVPGWAHANPLRFHAEQCADAVRPEGETSQACAQRVADLLNGRAAPRQNDPRPNAQSETSRNCTREARRDPDSGDSSSSASCSWSRSWRSESRR